MVQDFFNSLGAVFTNLCLSKHLQFKVTLDENLKAEVTAKAASMQDQILYQCIVMEAALSGCGENISKPRSETF